MSTIGLFGSLLLTFCAIPELYRTIKDKKWAWSNNKSSKEILDLALKITVLNPEFAFKIEYAGTDTGVGVGVGTEYAGTDTYTDTGVGTDTEYAGTGTGTDRGTGTEYATDNIIKFSDNNKKNKTKKTNTKPNNTRNTRTNNTIRIF